MRQHVCKRNEGTKRKGMEEHEGSCRYEGIMLRMADTDWWVMAPYLDRVVTE